MVKTKLAVITSSGFTQREGISSLLFDNFSRFDRERFEIHLIISGQFSSEWLACFEAIGCIPEYMPDRQKRPWQYFFSLHSFLKQAQIQALYVNGSSSILGLDLLAGRLAGCVKRVVHSHNTQTDHPFLNLGLRPLLRAQATKNLACGQAAGHWLFGQAPFQVINNGRSIATYQFAPDTREQLRKRYGLNPDTLVVGHVGMFNPQKNQAFAVSVFAALLQGQPNVELWLIGTGALMEAVANLAKSMHVDHRVRFLGSIDNVPEVLQAMDVMLLPSRFEGVPLVAVEWQLAGLPCILSDAVTSECIFGTPVVQMSLDTAVGDWANRVIQLNLSHRNHRLANSQANVQQAKVHGFDVEDNAKKLQQILAV